MFSTDIKAPWTEGEIQQAIYLEMCVKGHGSMLPNCFVFQNGCESDMISTTKAGYVWEYEIKVSKSDFYADKQKTRHDRYMNPDNYLITERGPQFPRPNRFFYVTPKGLVTDKAVPPYAGLIELERLQVDKPWHKRYRMQTVVPAPLAHREKPPLNFMLRVGKTFSFKYWDVRLEADNV